MVFVTMEALATLGRLPALAILTAITRAVRVLSLLAITMANALALARFPDNDRAVERVPPTAQAYPLPVLMTTLLQVFESGLRIDYAVALAALKLVEINLLDVAVMALLIIEFASALLTTGLPPDFAMATAILPALRLLPRLLIRIMQTILKALLVFSVRKIVVPEPKLKP